MNDKSNKRNLGLLMSKKSKGIKWKFPKPADSTGFLLWQAHNNWQKEIKRALKPLDLTHVQFVLLSSLIWLETQQKVITQTDLAEVAKTDIMMTSNVLKKLEVKQLIVRKDHPSDSRANTIALTKEGLSLAKAGLKALEKFDSVLFSNNLGKDETQFKDHLKKIL